MNRIEIGFSVVATAAAITIGAFLLGGAHREAEAEARGAMVDAVRSIDTLTATCELLGRVARSSPTPKNRTRAEEDCGKATDLEARLPSLVDAYRKACRACASDERCEDEIALIRRLGSRVGAKSACDD